MKPEIVETYLSFRRPPGPVNTWKVLDVLWNGISIKITIQEIPEDRYDDIVDHMCQDFIRDEAFFKNFKVKDNLEAFEEIRNLWKEILKCGISVAAFIEDPTVGGGKPLIIGANILYVSTEKSRSNSKRVFKAFKTKNLSMVIKLIEEFTSEAKIDKVYDTEKYLIALGLSVNSSFRGLKLGGHLLSVRNLIGEKYGISATGNVFSADAAITLAKREGFQCLVKKLPNEILDEKGKLLFKTCKSASFQFMGKKLLQEKDNNEKISEEKVTEKKVNDEKDNDEKVN